MDFTNLLQLERLPDATAGGSRLGATTIWHAQLQIAFQAAHDFLLSPAAFPFFYIFGPTGVGKSKLLEAITAMVHHVFRDAMLADPSLIPILTVVAPKPSKGTFSFREFAMRILKEADYPACGQAIPPSRASAITPAGEKHRFHGVSESELLSMAATWCRRRGVQVINVDEAGHLAVVARSKRARDQMNLMKDFAQEAGVRFIFAGVYDLLDFRAASGELARRARSVHLARYHVTVKREMAAFEKAATEMLGLLDGADIVGRPEWAQQLHAQSSGCLGILRDLLIDAEARFERLEGSRSFSGCLDDAAPEALEKETIERDIREGERRYAERIPLALVAPPKPAEPKKAPGQALAVTQRRKPGERNPTRDRTKAHRVLA